MIHLFKKKKRPKPTAPNPTATPTTLAPAPSAPSAPTPTTPAPTDPNQKNTTDPQDIRELIHRLHPYNTQHKLIRLGPKRDGGYLVPDDLHNIEACFSPGVANVSKFEMACLKRGMKIYMADKSVDQPNLKTAKENYHFLKKFIGCTNNEDTITMDQWVSEHCPSSTSDLLLQMDIEGAEYYSIINMTDALLRRFRIMVIEFHGLHEFWNKHVFKLNKTVFDKILQTHLCVHIHPNNCCGIVTHQGIEIPKVAEFTFLRKDRVTQKEYATKFPHRLDYKNCNKDDISLPTNWYGGYEHSNPKNE